MAKAEKKKISRIKVVKKNWCKIMAPPLFGNKEIGEIYVNNPENALGRVLHYNLKELTGNVKDQNAYVVFRLTRLEGNIIHTAIIGYELTLSSAKRLVRKNADRLDDYFVLRTKNKEEVIVKTIMITLHKTQRSLQAKLRK